MDTNDRWREKYYDKVEELNVSEVHNNAMVAEIQKLRSALREIMRQGTGSQGNSVEATMAYEALGE